MKLSAENLFILNALKSFLSSSPMAMDAARSWQTLDWGKMMAVAEHHKLTPLLHHVLSNSALLEKIPPRVARQLRENYLAMTALGLLYEEFLGHVAQFFESNAIPFLIIKGPSMALEFYNPSPIRPYGDLDIVIRYQDYDKVKRHLGTMGFGVAQPEKEIIRRKYFNSVEFCDLKNRGIAIDLHWDTVMISWNHEPFLTSEEIWNNLRWYKTPQLKFSVLQPMHLIPYLCLHLSFHHQFGRLLTLCDLDLAVQKFAETGNWEKILALVVKSKIRKPVYYSLALCRTLLDSKIPEWVLGELRVGGLEEWAFPIEYLVFCEKPIPTNLERFIKFILIDDLAGKGYALQTFLKQRQAAKRIKACFD